MADVLAHHVIRELQMIAHHPERGPTEKQSSLWILPPFAPASQSPEDLFPMSRVGAWHNTAARGYNAGAGKTHLRCKELKLGGSPMRKIEIKQIDAFTESPFQGNPAGVVLRAEGLTSRQMQKIAKEMNLSETAFVVKRRNQQFFGVRFFTPEREVDLCGHATIATFYALSETGEIQPSTPYAEVLQETKAGLLPVRIFFKQKHPRMILMGQAAPLFQNARVRPKNHCKGVGDKDLLTGSPNRPDREGFYRLVASDCSNEESYFNRPGKTPLPGTRRIE